MSDAALPTVSSLSGTELSSRATASAWEVWAKMRPLVVIAVIASALVSAGFAFLKTDLRATPDHGFPHAALLGLLQALAESLIATPVAIATHRLILKKETTPGIITLRKSYEWSFFFWLVGLTAVPSLLMDLSDWVGVSVLTAAVAIAALFLWFNSILVFPAVAIEVPSASASERFKSSRKQMRGHYWLFIRALIMAIFPLLVLAFFVGLAIVIAEFSLPYHAVPEQVWEVLRRGTIGLFKPASIMLGAAVASWLFLYVKQRSAA